ncbi:MAG: cytochrome-c oxidase, cbb3-type subunit III [Alphaproteobacteria bacterium]|nr:cytochrome-c oxidase, cbb3-type subunit III [Alphaproteobacteria bacterium]
MSDQNKPEIDKISGVETTGHEWDGLKELNNPAPRWWLWIFYVTCIWSFGYWVVYPAWPTLSGHTKGTLGWTQFKKLENEQAEITVRQATYADAFKNASFEQIMKDEKLYTFAVAGGKAAFKNNCATCHGSGAQGGKGYPNLNDDDWLWGGKVSDIYQTLQYGIRSGHDEARVSQMPSFGKDGVLKQDEIKGVAEYVIALSEGKATADMAGAKVFAENCAACHGEQGQGGREVGAPKLADAIWLYGGDEKTVYETVYNARAGVMPYWKGKLSDDTLRMLTVYVHSLGGGEAEEQQAAAPAPAPEAVPAATEGEQQQNATEQQPAAAQPAPTGGEQQ